MNDDQQEPLLMEPDVLEHKVHSRYMSKEWLNFVAQKMNWILYGQHTDIENSLAVMKQEKWSWKHLYVLSKMKSIANVVHMYSSLIFWLLWEWSDFYQLGQLDTPRSY